MATSSGDARSSDSSVSITKNGDGGGEIRVSESTLQHLVDDILLSVEKATRAQQQFLSTVNVAAIGFTLFIMAGLLAIEAASSPLLAGVGLVLAILFLAYVYLQYRLYSESRTVRSTATEQIDLVTSGLRTDPSEPSFGSRPFDSPFSRLLYESLYADASAEGNSQLSPQVDVAVPYQWVDEVDSAEEFVKRALYENGQLDDTIDRSNLQAYDLVVVSSE